MWLHSYFPWLSGTAAICATVLQNQDLALKACVIPPFPLVQACSFPVVQPCSAGGDLLKDPLGLSKAIKNRQNSKWGDLHWFPHCSVLCTVDLGQHLWGVQVSPGSWLLPRLYSLSYSCQHFVGFLPDWWVGDCYLSSPLSCIPFIWNVSALRQSQPSTRQSFPTSLKSALEKGFSWMVNNSFFPVVLHVNRWASELSSPLF